MVTPAREREPISLIKQGLKSDHRHYQRLRELPADYDVVLVSQEGLEQHALEVESCSAKIINSLSFIRPDRLPQKTLDLVCEAKKTGFFAAYVIAAPVKDLEGVGGLKDEVLVVGCVSNKSGQPVKLGRRCYPSNGLSRLVIYDGDGFMISPNHVSHLWLVDKNPARSQ